MNLKELDRKLGEALSLKNIIIISIIIFFIIILGIKIAETKENKIPKSIKQFFIQYKLGNPKLISLKNNEFVIVADNIKYNGDIENNKLSKLYVGSTRHFQIFNSIDNDMILDKKEKTIIERMKKFKEISHNFDGIPFFIEDDIEKYLRNPDTLKIKEVKVMDIGKKYVLIITITSLNDFGVEKRSIIKYEINFEADTYQMIDLI